MRWTAVPRRGKLLLLCSLLLLWLFFFDKVVLACRLSYVCHASMSFMKSNNICWVRSLSSWISLIWWSFFSFWWLGNSCLTPWLAHHNTCPICRTELPSEPEDNEIKKPSQVSGLCSESWRRQILINSTMHLLSWSNMMVMQNGLANYSLSVVLVGFEYLRRRNHLVEHSTWFKDRAMFFLHIWRCVLCWWAVFACRKSTYPVEWTLI